MGLSNYIPSSRLIQPGVCTSTTRPASPYEGMVIYETDTNKMYVYDGSAWVIPNSPAQNPAGLELIANVTLSGASINTGSIFSSTYENYRIVLSNPTVNTSSSGIYLRMRSGSSTDSTATFDMAYRGIRDDASNWDSVSTAETSFNIWYSSLTSSSGILGASSFDIYGPYLAQRTFFNGQMYAYNGGYYTRSGGAVHTNQTSYDALTFLTNTAATMTGTVAIYGYRNTI